MKLLAPNNEADFPLTCSQERDERTGKLEWVIDVHVKIPGITEYSLTGRGDDFAKALRKAYLGLNSEAKIRRQANDSNNTFGVEV